MNVFFCCLHFGSNDVIWQSSQKWKWRRGKNGSIMKQKQIGCHLLVAVDARNWIWSSYDILVTDSFRFLIEGIKKKVTENFVSKFLYHRPSPSKVTSFQISPPFPKLKMCKIHLANKLQWTFKRRNKTAGHVFLLLHSLSFTFTPFCHNLAIMQFSSLVHSSSIPLFLLCSTDTWFVCTQD